MIRYLTLGLALAALSACGKTSSDPRAAPEGSAGEAAGGAPNGTEAGLGPIDAAAQPIELPLTCAGRTEMLTLKLPCLVGYNLNGSPDTAGYHATECQLVGKPDETAISFTLPLVELPKELNRRLHLPLAAPPLPPSTGVTLGGEQFGGTLSGDITFTEVDLAGRAFVAQLENGHVTWSGDQGTSFECNTVDGPIWGQAGGFL